MRVSCGSAISMPISTALMPTEVRYSAKNGANAPRYAK
jgi:hypothetical protein